MINTHVSPAGSRGPIYPEPRPGDTTAPLPVPADSFTSKIYIKAITGFLLLPLTSISILRPMHVVVGANSPFLLAAEQCRRVDAPQRANPAPAGRRGLLLVWGYYKAIMDILTVLCANGKTLVRVVERLQAWVLYTSYSVNI